MSGMSQRRFLTVWFLATGAIAVITAALVAVRDFVDVKNGGPTVVLSDAGCFGGSAAGAGPSASDCSRTEWLYTPWWVWPVAVLLVGLAVGRAAAWVRSGSNCQQSSAWEPSRS